MAPTHRDDFAVDEDEGWEVVDGDVEDAEGDTQLGQEDSEAEEDIGGSEDGDMDGEEGNLEDEDIDMAAINEMFSGLDKPSEKMRVEEEDIEPSFLPDNVATPFLLDDDPAAGTSLEGETISEGFKWQRRERDGTRREADWRTKGGSDFYKLVLHVSHVIRLGLKDVSKDFQRSFCALHLLWMFASQLPIDILFTKESHKEKLEEEREATQEDAEMKGEGNRDTERKREETEYFLLNQIIRSAYRCSSARIGGDRRLHSQGIDVIFTDQNFSFGNPRVKKAFRAVQESSPTEHLAALKFAGEKVIEALSNRLEEDTEKFEIVQGLLSAARQSMTRRRTDRTMKQLVQKSQGISVKKHKKKTKH